MTGEQETNTSNSEINSRFETAIQEAIEELSSVKEMTQAEKNNCRFTGAFMGAMCGLLPSLTAAGIASSQVEEPLPKFVTLFSTFVITEAASIGGGIMASVPVAELQRENLLKEIRTKVLNNIEE